MGDTQKKLMEFISEQWRVSDCYVPNATLPFHWFLSFVIHVSLSFSSIPVLNANDSLLTLLIGIEFNFGPDLFINDI